MQDLPIEKKYETVNSIISNSPAIVFIWKAEDGWPIEFVSENISIFGYSAKEFLERTVYYRDLIHPEDLKKIEDDVWFQTEKAEQESFTQEYRIITKEGNTAWVDDRKTIKRDKDRKIIRYEGVIFDITSKKKNRIELEKLKRSLEDAQKVTHLGHWEYEIDNNLLTCSDEAYRMFGYRPGEIKPTLEALWKHIHVDDRERVRKIHQESRADKKEYKSEYRIVKKDGEVRYIKEQCRHFEKVAGDGFIQLGTILDITDEKILEKRLKEKEHYIEAIFDSQESIQIATNGSYLLKANRAFLEYFDYKNVEDFRKEHQCICEYFEDTKEKEYISSKVAGEGWINLILENPKMDYKVKILGDVFAVSVRKITGIGRKEYVATFSNISEIINYQKELEFQVDRAVLKLEKQNKLLLKQSKQAAMGSLIGVIGHQLKQPLNSIGLNAQLLEEFAENNMLEKEQVKKLASSIFKKVMFMSETVNDFKNFFRPNKTLKIFSVEKTVEKTAELIQAQLFDHKIAFDFQCEEEVKIEGVESELQQVLMNLFFNAKDVLVEKKTKDPKINVILTKREDRAVISVEDNGGGIPKEVLPNIFDSFFTTKGEDGTGIGLNLSKMLIEESMGGKLTVENTGRGAVFHIALKAAK